MYSLILSHRADRALERLDDATVERILAALEYLLNGPYVGKDIKKLRGSLEGKYRLRIGRIRAVYMVLEQEGIVRVDDIAYRGSIY